MLIALFFWITAAAWSIVVIASVAGILRMPRLPRMPSGTAAELPLVTVVIAVRDEVEHIEETVRRLLKQRDVDLEIIVVDDRSTDGTATVLERFNDPRVRTVRVERLPEGWVGKCHALHIGTAEARGPWVLLTDADIWMTPHVVARALTAAVREDADHICLMPRQRRASLLGKASIMMLFIGMPDAIGKANRGRGGMGLGAFNLVRADALADIGGYAGPLRMEIMDDHQLGLLLFRAGKRTRGYLAPDVEMDLARTPAGVVRAMEKNAFAILRYNVPGAVAMGLIGGTLLAGGVAGPFTASVSGIAAGGALMGMAIPGVVLARRYGWPVRAGMLAPLGLFVILVGGANSVVKTLLRGGVRWRGEFYPLADLRKARVR